MAIYSEFSHKKNVIFHSYVSLPEGTFIEPDLKNETDMWLWLCLNLHHPFSVFFGHPFPKTHGING